MIQDKNNYCKFYNYDSLTSFLYLNYNITHFLSSSYFLLLNHSFILFFLCVSLLHSTFYIYDQEKKSALNIILMLRFKNIHVTLMLKKARQIKRTRADLSKLGQTVQTHVKRRWL